MYCTGTSYHNIATVEIDETILTPQEKERTPFKLLKIRIKDTNGNDHEISVFGEPVITYLKEGV
jgi:hypothetical protein